MYCGHSILIKDIIQLNIVSHIDNLLGMACTAAQTGNVEGALSYYNRVLKLDSKISEAWFEKGRAAGWASSLGNIRTTEMLIALNMQ